jgi:hypothetical protein
MASRDLADVISVSITGQADQYYFSVGISSPDAGCHQYADWWEVTSTEGELLYRRILLHSHVNEQPFERSGGPVEIDPDQGVLVRAHMNPAGYGGAAFEGTVEGGFRQVELGTDFAPDLGRTPPLPEDCAF